MKDFFECLTTTNGLAFGTGVLIFLFTFFLVVNRLIGFTLTLLFLVFALAASFGVANHETVKTYFDNLTQTSKLSAEEEEDSVRKDLNSSDKPIRKDSNSSDKPVRKDLNSQLDLDSINEKLEQALEKLKEEYEILKKKFIDYLNESEKNNDKNNTPSERPNRSGRTDR